MEISYCRGKEIWSSPGSDLLDIMLMHDIILTSVLEIGPAANNKSEVATAYRTPHYHLTKTTSLQAALVLLRILNRVPQISFSSVSSFTTELWDLSYPMPECHPATLRTGLTCSVWTLNQRDFAGELERSLCEWDREAGDSECLWNYTEEGNSSSGDPKQQRLCSFEELGETPSLEESESKHQWDYNTQITTSRTVESSCSPKHPWLSQKGSPPWGERAFFSGKKV